MFKQGDRVEMVHMGQDPDPVPSGTLGTVKYVAELKFSGEPEQLQVAVDWDNGRRLSCVIPPDVLRRVVPQNT